MKTKENVRETHDAILTSIKFTDGTEGFGQATELGCLIHQPQDNGWFVVTEYNFEGVLLSQGYEKGA